MFHPFYNIIRKVKTIKFVGLVKQIKSVTLTYSFVNINLTTFQNLFGSPFTDGQFRIY